MNVERWKFDLKNMGNLIIAKICLNNILFNYSKITFGLISVLYSSNLKFDAFKLIFEVLSKRDIVYIDGYCL